MLDPQERALLLEGLRPPVGYRLDRAIGTTYSLDLMALLTAPLAFTFFDWEDQDGKPATDPVALLESIRRNADRIHLFCQTGEIKLPPPNQRLMAYLERMVVPVQVAANASGVGGIFHPKIWLLRYVADGAPVCYRFICATRNLTFDRSWDIVLCVDGVLADRTNAISASRPLGDFIEALPGFAVRPMNDEARADVVKLAEEVKRVRFEWPDNVEEATFWPLGIEGYRKSPFKNDRRKGSRLLVVSPFLSASFLRDLVRGREEGCTLVSRPDQLASMPADLLEVFGSTFTLASRTIDPEEDREVQELTNLAGLHAKLFIADEGWNSRLLVGSANATSAAFERNVEFSVELYGKRKDFGIDAVLGEADGKKGLRPLLESWQMSDHVPTEEEAISEALDKELGELRRLISGQPLFLRCRAEVETPDRYVVELRTSSVLPALSPTTWSTWLATQPEESAVKIEAGARKLALFGPVDFTTLTAFLACRLSAGRKGITRESRFVLKLPVEGLPEDRLERLLAAQIQDRDRLLRLLLLLLQPDGSASAMIEEMMRGDSKKGEGSSGAATTPIFEALVRATVDGRERLADMGKLLADLQRTSAGASLIPSELTSLWKEIEQALKESDD